jgi:hypothetical protein
MGIIKDIEDNSARIEELMEDNHNAQIGDYKDIVPGKVEIMKRAILPGYGE